jgi:hypothetical protein
MAPHDRQTTSWWWWWLSPTRASYRAIQPVGAKRRAGRAAVSVRHVVDGLVAHGPVAHGLVAHLTETLTHCTDDRFGVGVRMVVYRGQHRYPGTRHTQSDPAQRALDVRSRWHAP